MRKFWKRQRLWWEKSWWETTKESLHRSFVNFMAYLCITRGWTWLDVIISNLCQLEVNFRLAKNPELLEELQTCDICTPSGKSIAQTRIPENDLYCSGCPYFTSSKLAKFFYGDHMDGYCYYLNQGDFSFGHSTDLLWDMCKCCEINTDIEEDEYEEDAPAFYSSTDAPKYF